MYDNATKDQFIELRARGIPYVDIAEQLQVDKSTLVRWNQQFGARIQNLRQMRLEQLQQKILGSQEEQFEALATEYHAITTPSKSGIRTAFPSTPSFTSPAGCVINSKNAW